jgi:hypothetical protein
MKQGIYSNPVNSSTAEEVPAVSTCGKYQRISKENTGCRLISIPVRSGPDKMRYGTQYDIKNNPTNDVVGDTNRFDAFLVVFCGKFL